MTQVTPGRVVGSDRVLAVLVALAGQPQGATLDELATSLASPKPTVHRALASLRRAGLATQDGRGSYLLGDEFLRLAFTHHEARPAHVRVAPVLEALATQYGETAHYAVLDGAEIVYRAKVDPSGGAIKLSSVVGGRNPAHCTAVGKVLLAHALPDDAAVRRWVAAHAPLERRTPKTLTSARKLAAELAQVRAQGYASEEEENEPGIGCLAVPVHLTSTTRPDGAISISALSYRTPMTALVADLDRIRELVEPLQLRASA